MKLFKFRLPRWLRRWVCRRVGHVRKYVGSFSGGSSWQCPRCGAFGDSFEKCPSFLGDTTIMWRG